MQGDGIATTVMLRAARVRGAGRVGVRRRSRAGGGDRRRCGLVPGVQGSCPAARPPAELGAGSARGGAAGDDPARLDGCTPSAWTRLPSWPPPQPGAQRSRPASSLSTAGRGCWTWWKAEAERPCPAGFLTATRAGGTGSRWPRWTRSAATPPRYAPACRRPPVSSTPSMWSASVWTPRPGPPPSPTGDRWPPRARRRPAVPDPPAAAPRI